MTEMRITGGCQCGAVRYALHAEPRKPCICHCRMCQKQFGNYFGAFAGVDDRDFEITRGDPTIFRSSDEAERLFCAACGTPLGFRFVGASRISVAHGSLDHPEAVKPVVQYGVESRLPWLAEIIGLPGTVTGEDDPAPQRYDRIRSHNHQHPDHDTPTWPIGTTRP